jgi:hypothetical protein
MKIMYDYRQQKACKFRKICCFHGGDYEEYRFVGCYAVWLL